MSDSFVDKLGKYFNLRKGFTVCVLSLLFFAVQVTMELGPQVGMGYMLPIATLLILLLLIAWAEPLLEKLGISLSSPAPESAPKPTPEEKPPGLPIGENAE